MSADASQPWSCPQCERRVPSRQDICHCGFDRRRWPGGHIDASTGQEATPAARDWRLWAALAAVVVCGLIFATLTQRDGGPAGTGRSPAGTGPSDYPSLPAAGPEGEPSSAEVPAVEGRPPVGAGEPTPAAEKRTAAPPTPPLTAVDAARQQAIDLLEPLIRPIARQADLLDLRFRSYLESCRPDFRGGRRPGASRFWFMVWTDRAELRWKDEMAAIPANPEAPDCRATWIEVVEGANSVGSALEAFEETARTNGVLPEHVDVLLAAHFLTGWREHFERHRRRQ